MRAVMLAAGVGRRLGSNHDLPPKPLLRIGGRSLLERHVEVLRNRGVDHLVLVVGHREAELRAEVARIGAGDFVRLQRNPDYTRGSVVSLWCARASLGEVDDVLIMDADVLYHAELIDRLIAAPARDCLLLDRGFEPGEEPVKVGIRGTQVVEFGKTVDADGLDFMGEWPGFLKLSAATGRELVSIMADLVQAGRPDTPMEDAVRALILRRPGVFGWRDVTGLPWIEIDFLEDLERAKREILPRIEAVRQPQPAPSAAGRVAPPRASAPPGVSPPAAGAAAAVAGVAPELHLCVIWSSGRSEEQAILADLQSRFEICRVHEVCWSPALVVQNYSRFYRGRLIPPYRNVELKKGSGPFLIVTVIDRAPCYAMRDTLHGRAEVNANLFDAKVRYRDWTGPGHLVHASDTAAEARRDLFLLLGCEVEDYLRQHAGSWDGAIQRADRDLAGARRWHSAGQLLDALNCSVDYVLLGAGDSFAETRLSDDGFDLLTDNYIETIAVTNARPLLGRIPRWGGRFLVRIGARDVAFNCRFVGDRYFDPAWQRAVLERREWCQGGFFRPCAADNFETLAYHALIHRRVVPAPHKERLVAMAAALGRGEWTSGPLDDPARARQALDALLAGGGYGYVEPLDPFAFYNFEAAGAAWAGARQRLARVRRGGAWWSYRWSTQLRAQYFTLRDQLARSTPALRKVVRLWRGQRRREGFKAPTRPEPLVARSASRSPAVTGDLE